MKRLLLLTIILLCICTLLAAGCSTPAGQTAASPKSAGDSLVAQGETEFQNNNIHAAERLFVLAQENYTAAGDSGAALQARHRAAAMNLTVREFPYNRSQMETILATFYPDVPAAERASWLPCDQSQCIESDGETWYFQTTAMNVQYHNFSLIRKALAKMGSTPFYDQLTPYAFSPYAGTGHYVNPVAWEGTEDLSIPAGNLPESGTLRIWVPLPIETESQQNVTIISVEPAAYVKSSTGTDADIGMVYLEVPLENRTGDFVNVSARFRFTAYEQRFTIDPATVGEYNTSDPLYRKYTGSSRNIVVTPEIIRTAGEITGTETNPYLKAQKIYRYVISRPYSLVPHDRLNGLGIPETEYVSTTGFGDCGTQSMYFVALCRAAGIPARTTGGQQIVPGYGGDHFWSEYYLPGYGWIPNDVTVAEAAEWSYNATDAQREQYKQYYSENLDPYRYIIQLDADLPLVPDPGTTTAHVGALQAPKIVCDTCTADPDTGLPTTWTVTLVRV